MFRNFATYSSNLAFLNLYGNGKGGTIRGGLFGNVILPGVNFSFSFSSFFSTLSSSFSSSTFSFSFSLGSPSSFPLLRVRALHYLRFFSVSLGKDLGGLSFIESVTPRFPVRPDWRIRTKFGVREHILGLFTFLIRHWYIQVL